jgi:hypothetical protein
MIPADLAGIQYLALSTRYQYGDRSPECVEWRNAYQRNYYQRKRKYYYREYQHHYYEKVTKPKRQREKAQ